MLRNGCLMYLLAVAIIGCKDAFLFSNDSRTLMSFVEEEADGQHSLNYTELRNGKWSIPKEIIGGADWFVNWADYPMIAENKGHLWSHILQKSSEGTYSYDVKMNVLPKETTVWQTNLPLHTDGTPTEHGFVSVLPYQDGFFVTWLDGRNTLENVSGQRGAMTIRAVSKEQALDASTCDCCQTTAAITANGPIVLYRDRSADELRDISIVRKVKGEWTPPKTIHKDGWYIKGCPVNGPKAAAKENNVVVAWYTAANSKPRIHLAFSADGGASFDPPIRVDEENAIGRVDVILFDKNTAVVSWMDAKDDKAQLQLRKVMRSGQMSAIASIAELSAARSAGFPQMELVDEHIYLAWTDKVEGKNQVKTATIGMNYFLAR